MVRLVGLVLVGLWWLDLLDLTRDVGLVVVRLVPVDIRLVLVD